MMTGVQLPTDAPASNCTEMLSEVVHTTFAIRGFLCRYGEKRKRPSPKKLGGLLCSCTLYARRISSRASTRFRSPVPAPSRSQLLHLAQLLCPIFVVCCPLEATFIVTRSHDSQQFLPDACFVFRCAAAAASSSLRQQCRRCHLASSRGATQPICYQRHARSVLLILQELIEPRLDQWKGHWTRRHW